MFFDALLLQRQTQPQQYLGVWRVEYKGLEQLCSCGCVMM